MLHCNLGLDVEFDVALLGQRENFVERRHARAGDRRLLREAGIPHLAAIPLLHFGERQFVNRGLLDVAAAHRRMEVGIVRHHDHVVLGHGHVEFERIDAEADRVFERRQRILRPHRAAAAMGMDQNLCLSTHD